MVIGVISDTHGRLDPAVEKAFAHVERIVHAGDVGDEAIIARLGAISPLTMVRGNCDDAPWGLALPGVANEVIEGLRVVVVHDRTKLEAQAAPEHRQTRGDGFDVLIHGHTHVAAAGREADVFCLNPGSASQPRHGSPRSVALLHIEGGTCRAEIRTLGHDLLL